MEITKENILELVQSLDSVRKALKIEEKKARIDQILAQSGQASFWQDQEKAKQMMIELSDLQETVDAIDNAQKKLEILDTNATDAAAQFEAIKREIEKLETKTFLSGKYDKEPAIISVHAGQGGTEAMDWAQMLERMYIRYAQKRGWQCTQVDLVLGEEAGIKSATIIADGPYAYGQLKHEAGTHRLVRQSPFNANQLRQTSFALVEVLPQLPENESVEAKEDDLQWQFYHSSSQGGQNVQKVSTAVRLIHKPTGITVTAQSERFQEQNRKIALRLLSAKLWAKQQEDLLKTKKELKGEYHPASWGTQIRSYVLHPYKLVKDLRTGVETSAAENVLDGNLDEFIDSQIRLLGRAE